MVSVLNRVLIVLFQAEFSNQKTLFLGTLYFYCLLYNLRDYLFRCVVCNFLNRDRKLFFHVRLGKEICRLVSYDLGIFQVRLAVQSLEKLESLPIFCLCLCLM